MRVRFSRLARREKASKQLNARDKLEEILAIRMRKTNSGGGNAALFVSGALRRECHAFEIEMSCSCAGQIGS